MSSGSDSLAVRERLLPWFDENARDLPWRRSAYPYAIWVSEIMLQQTRVAAVIKHYTRFMQSFPTLESLAAAPEGQVLAHWSGLGYYRRARLLHKAARFVAGEMGGRLPRTAATLRSLPGIGDYTAAAVASIGFGEAVACVDGNVERVLCRLRGWHEGQVKTSKLRAEANLLLDQERPGDFNQAMMELGALVCLPQAPRCSECPLRELCQTRGEHPVAERRKMASRQLTYAFLLRNAKRRKPQVHAVQVLLEKRSATSAIMPGMWELPELDGGKSAKAKKVLTLRHSITDTNYYVTIYEWGASERLMLPKRENTRRWFMVEELHTLPLTGLARKALQRLRAWPGYDAYGPVVRFVNPPVVASSAQ